MNKKRNLLLLGVGIAAILTGLFVLLAPDKSRDSSGNNSPSKQTSENINNPSEKNEKISSTRLSSTERLGARPAGSKNLTGVNPEEQIPIIKQAQLPYETDEFAITFLVDATAPHGAIIVVIDKASTDGVSTSIRDQALAYLTARGLPTNELKIEYKTR